MMAVKTITGKIADEFEKSDNTTELQIFDKKTGSYIRVLSFLKWQKKSMYMAITFTLFHT
ncbi:MAG: hypothetical protein U5K71_00720 [Gracilimonas sp.]|nr:hypothetical protein [Gracilimonas sp.]